MKMMFDLTEALHEWTSFLSDMRCNIEDLHSTIHYYDPGRDALFLDELIESDDPTLADDVIVFIRNSAETLLRDNLDNYMLSIGYEIVKIIKVFMLNLNGVIMSIMDVNPIEGRVHAGIGRSIGRRPTMALVS